MSLRLHRRLLTSILAGMFVTAPATFAFAQPDEDEEMVEEEEDVDLDEGADDEEIPPPADDSGGFTGDDGSSWGVGGEEPEGKYKPAGKTGKLAELEEEEEEEEEVAEGPPALPPPGWVSLDTYIGTGNILVVRSEGGPTNVTPTGAFIAGFGYRIADMWEAYARFGVMTGANNGPRAPFVAGARDPDQYKQISTGGLELGFKPWIPINRDLVIPVWLSLTLPTGQGDMFAGPDNRANFGKRVVNLAAAASTGYRERAIFASKRFAITPGAGLRWQIPDLGPGKLRVEADTKIDIMVKTGGTDPGEAGFADDSGAELKSVSINWFLGGGAGYDMFDELLKAGLNMWLVVGTADETFASLDPGGAQFVFEPNVGTHVDFTGDESFGMDGRVGFILPAGGELGGGGPLGGSIYGFNIKAGFFF